VTFCLNLQNKSEGKEYSVEVVLDNSDQRVALSGAEIKVKKTYNIDADRDTYFLNGVHV